MLMLPEVLVMESLPNILGEVSGGLPYGHVHPCDVNNIRPPEGGLLPGCCNHSLGDVAIYQDVQMAFVLPGELFHPEVADVAITLVTERSPEPIIGLHDICWVFDVLGQGEGADYPPGAESRGIHLDVDGAPVDFVENLVLPDFPAVRAVIALTGGGPYLRLAIDDAPEETHGLRAN